MINIVVVYHSGYGHTQKQAEAVLYGLAEDSDVEAILLPIDSEGNIYPMMAGNLWRPLTQLSLVLLRTWGLFPGNLKNLRMHQANSGLNKNGRINLLQVLPIHQE